MQAVASLVSLVVSQPVKHMQHPLFGEVLSPIAPALKNEPAPLYAVSAAQLDADSKQLTILSSAVTALPLLYPFANRHEPVAVPTGRALAVAVAGAVLDADMVPLRKAKLMVFDFYEICPTDSQDTKL